MKLGRLSIFTFLIVSQTSIAQTEEFSTSVDYAKFQDQDEMFWDRENISEAAIYKTIQEYDNLLKSGLKGDDLFYAVYQANKLSIFYGDHVLTKEGGDIKKRIDLFSACEQRADSYLHPSKLKAPYNTSAYLAQYYSWKFECMGLRAEVASSIVQGIIATELKIIKDVTLKLDVTLNSDGTVSVTTANHVFGDLPPCFDSGAIMRTFAGLMSNKKADVFGLYNLEKAVLWAEASLRVKKDNSSFCFSDGTNYFHNFIYKSDALLGQGKNKEAKDVLAQALRRYLPSIAGHLDHTALVQNLEAFSVGSGDGLEAMLPEQKVQLLNLADAYEAIP